MFGQDRNQLRQMFFTAWHKHQSGEPTEPLEGLIVQIIEQHPEYHSVLKDEQAALDRDYTPEMGETNPFLHMAMHIAIREQVATQRPAGIAKLYSDLLNKYPDSHEVEHQMMECLGEMIWQSQRNNTMPDEVAYLDCLRERTQRR